MIATDWLLVTLVQSASIVVASLLMERALSVGAVVLGLAGVQVLMGVLWLALAVPAEARSAPSVPAEAI